jgi:hypothetical protein
LVVNAYYFTLKVDSGHVSERNGNAAMLSWLKRFPLWKVRPRIARHDWRLDLRAADHDRRLLLAACRTEKMRERGSSPIFAGAAAKIFVATEKTGVAPGTNPTELATVFQASLN